MPTLQTLGLGTHGKADLAALNMDVMVKLLGKELKTTYHFENFFHPYTEELITKLNRDSIPGLLDASLHETLFDDSLSEKYAEAGTPGDRVGLSWAPKEIDLEGGGPYSNYNWELLFHFPLAIAVHLSKNQRFAEAQRWFHYIFDPTNNDTNLPVPDRSWRFLKFRRNKDTTRVEKQIELLSKPQDERSATEKRIVDDLLDGYRAILASPFQPHAVARTRHLSYQYNVVMRYLDNLLAWGDSLFRQDTIESINEATQIYVQAANLLGRRPERIPKRGTSGAKTFHELKQDGLDEMGNTLVDLEGQIPFNFALPEDANDDAAGPLFGIGRTLYFCVPHNERMLGYWDSAADRLFKIRNCMNIEGVVRQLALFDPPIDPGMLVKAAAAGIDIGSIVSGLNQPVGPVRSMLLIQKAQELCSEVKSLGGALLSAIEKGDAERMAQLRQTHEIKIQEMTQEVRFLQWKRAQDATESLMRSRAAALERYRYYQRLLGAEVDSEATPDTLPLDRGRLTEENFEEAYAALVGTYEKEVPVHEYPKLDIAGETSPSNQSGATNSGPLYLNRNEDRELNVHLPLARDLRHGSSTADLLASSLVFIPDVIVNLQYWGLGGSTKVYGGDVAAEAAKMVAQIMRTAATFESDQAGLASRTASYERRGDDWRLQANSAAHELTQLGRQVLGSLIAEQVSRHEYETTVQQLSNSRAVDDLLHDKFSNQELYTWMQGEISRLYYEYYRFAFDTARQAEQSMKRELMRPELDANTYVKFNYWDGGRRGLLSGEALSLDVRRLERAYHESNKRELELTKHVSLRQLDPFALLTLKATGTCEVSIPEWLFDLDGAGHYMRRIKTASVSIPAVAGPYTPIRCTLTQLHSSIRKTAKLNGDAYEREGSEDGRFVDNFGSTQSIVTSSGLNDSGLFEDNLHDERTLPFENTGAVSHWKLELPTPYRSFNYETISDVVLHLRYTARSGGSVFRTAVNTYLAKQFAEASTSPHALLLDLKHEFPTEWSRFEAGAGFECVLTRDYFPYVTRGRALTITDLSLSKLEQAAVNRTTVLGLDLEVLSTALNDGGKFDLAVNPASTDHRHLLVTFTV